MSSSKFLHQILYYTLLGPACISLIIVGLSTRSAGKFDKYYLKLNDFMNKFKGNYQEIGT